VRFSEFVDVFVAALYNETQITGRTSFQIKDILNAYGLTLNSTWHDNLFKDYTFSSRVDASRRHLGPTEDQHVALSPEGLRWVEDHLGENVAVFLEQHGASHVPPGEEAFPEGVAEITGGRTFVSGDPAWVPTRPREGDVVFSDNVSAELVPASDRLVPLDHNSAPYRQVKDGLAALHEELRAANELPCAPEERERLLASLGAAQRLWEAAQLKVVQIQVGIIITIQDAVELLSKVGKAVGKSLLIDVIKSIVKHGSGIDL
jgi:hypothetical protein